MDKNRILVGKIQEHGSIHNIGFALLSKHHQVTKIFGMKHSVQISQRAGNAVVVSGPTLAIKLLMLYPNWLIQTNGQACESRI